MDVSILTYHLKNGWSLQYYTGTVFYRQQDTHVSESERGECENCGLSGESPYIVCI